MVDRRSTRGNKTARSTAKYAAIRDWLTGAIGDGTFKSGSLLPSEHDLMKRFSVSRVTVRQALEEVRGLGLIEKRQGKGTIVCTPRFVISLDRLQNCGEVMELLGEHPLSKVIEIGELLPERCVAKILRLARGSRVTRIERVRLADRCVMSVNVDYLPFEIGKRLAGFDLSRHDILLLLERELGIEIGYADVVIDTALASAKMADRLGVAPGQQVSRLSRVVFDAAGLPVHFERIFSPLGRTQFQVRLGRN